MPRLHSPYCPPLETQAAAPRLPTAQTLQGLPGNCLPPEEPTSQPTGPGRGMRAKGGSKWRGGVRPAEVWPGKHREGVPGPQPHCPSQGPMPEVRSQLGWARSDYPTRPLRRHTAPPRPPMTSTPHPQGRWPPMAPQQQGKAACRTLQGGQCPRQLDFHQGNWLPVVTGARSLDPVATQQ